MWIGRSAAGAISGVLLCMSLLRLTEPGTATCNAQTSVDPRQTFLSRIPDSPGSVILGRPTDRSVTLSVLWRDDVQAVVQYGAGDRLEMRSGPIVLKAEEPAEVIVENLQPDASYCYRVVDAATGRPLLPVAGNGRFHTQRAAGKAFVFTVQADSHLDGGCSLPLYELTLQNALSAEPDFHIDLGDTFMAGKISGRTVAMGQYKAQRHWLGEIGQYAPVYLVLGNHDGEEVFRGNASDADGLAVWSCLQRKRFFPNPVPDRFYTGNAQRQQHVGEPQDYYAWGWGDALFVVLDPYRYGNAGRGGREPWAMTLGKIQYQWLAETLRGSKAKFKFVFIHQLTGGLDKNGRGGAEAAALYEWGGHEADGTNTFPANRPGWEKPIHALLVETGVTILFHGHDHFFARQELDGVIYQLVPQPAHKNFRDDHAQEYGYGKGDFLPSSGHIRVSVSPRQVGVDYIRTADRNMEGQGIANGKSGYAYTCAGRNSETGHPEE